MTGPKQSAEAVARGASGEKRFKAIVRVDNATEVEYLESGGAFPFVLLKLHTSVHWRNPSDVQRN
jgi:aconitase A